MGSTASYLNSPCIQSVYNKIFETTSLAQLYWRGNYDLHLTSDIETKDTYCEYRGGFRIIIDKGLQFRVIDIEKSSFLGKPHTAMFIELLNDIDFGNVIMYGDYTDINTLSEDNQIIKYINNNKLALTNVRCQLSIYDKLFEFTSEMLPLIYNKYKLKLLNDFNTPNNDTKQISKKSFKYNINRSLLSKTCGQSIHNHIYETISNIKITYYGDRHTFDIKDINEHEINELYKMNEEKDKIHKTGFMTIIKDGIKFRTFDVIWKPKIGTRDKYYIVLVEMIEQINLNDILLFGDYNNMSNISKDNLLIKCVDGNTINLEGIIFNIHLDECNMFRFNSENEPINFNNQLLKFISN